MRLHFLPFLTFRTRINTEKTIKIVENNSLMMCVPNKSQKIFDSGSTSKSLCKWCSYCASSSYLWWNDDDDTMREINNDRSSLILKQLQTKIRLTFAIISQHSTPNIPGSFAHSLRIGDLRHSLSLSWK